MQELWPHQVRGLESIRAAMNEGHRRICVTAPTGAGKTRIATELIKEATKTNLRVAVYSNRKMIHEQTASVCDGQGIAYGHRAAGRKQRKTESVQLCMIQTEAARRADRGLYDADIVMVDEAHNQKGESSAAILEWHIEQGAILVGFTATPVGIHGLYEWLIVAGTNSELRRNGSLLPCYVYGPNEVDTRRLTYQSNGEFSEVEVSKRFAPKLIYGHVLAAIRKYNPDMRPGVLFAPSVAASRELCEKLNASGIPAGHIDGDETWIRDDRQTTSAESREQIREASRTGEVTYVCNRFVLREGIDFPWLYHCVTATAFGSVVSFLQSIGRLLRAHEGLDHVVWTDHGGNWWRHGSPNADRKWYLQDDANKIRKRREKALREKVEVEPIRCQTCGAVRAKGTFCPGCGTKGAIRTRTIIQLNGELKEMTGDVFKPRPGQLKSDTQKHWDSVYYSSRNSRSPRAMTFEQGVAMFFRKHRYWPPRNLERMPLADADWSRKIRDVHHERLINGNNKQKQTEALPG